MITLDDGLDARSITERDPVAGSVCAVNFYIVFGSYDREAVVASGRPQAGQTSVQEARDWGVFGWPNG